MGPRCDISLKSSEGDNIRTGIKSNQHKLHDRMLQSSVKKFHPVSVEDNLIIPIERPDKLTTLGQRNLIGVVTEVENDNYTIGTRDGNLVNEYSRDQFTLCSANSFQLDYTNISNEKCIVWYHRWIIL